MAIAKNNQVPLEFKRFYQSFLDLKFLLKSKAIELPAEKTVPVLMVCHYGTFVLSSLYKHLGLDPGKLYEARILIELMLGQEVFEVVVEHRVLLLSFVDNMGKALKTAKKPYVHIAMYNGHLDSEIYRLLHQDLAIYDFARYLYRVLSDRQHVLPRATLLRT
jgi:hypothetical protein